MHVFISAGEPSGDLHAANLVRRIRFRRPEVQPFGFGGAELKAVGADVLYPLAEHAIMGLSGIARALPTMLRIVDRAAREVMRRRPGAAVLIDYPGFHWHLARRLRKCGVPVISFVPPQIWAWASHRVNKVRQCFDRVLCSLPFEEEWYRRRGVAAEYVGHPYFDELHRRSVDARIAAEMRSESRPLVAVLPGSRHGEITRNLAMQLNSLRKIHQRRPDARFVFACFKPDHRDRIVTAARDCGVSVDAQVGRMPEILSAADAVIAVSGSVGLELLHFAVPSVIHYRVNPLYRSIARRVLNVPHISIVNLLAGRRLLPEFLTSRDESEAIAKCVLDWLDTPESAKAVRNDLCALRSEVGSPGACDRAAELVCEMSTNAAAA